MASKIARIFLTNFALFLLFHIYVQGDECPQQKDGPRSTNDRAAKLSGTGEFNVYDDKQKYKYIINLCKQNAADQIAVKQEELTTVQKTTYNVGYFNGSHVFGGTDWLMIEYFGAVYGSHCGNTRRKAIFFIKCDRSADTNAERTPKMLEEYRPDSDKNAAKNDADVEFCYYLFEMKHDAVCPPEKTKISPGSVFLIIVAIIGFLYLVLGLLYQRFIVGAKGMEQIPNYLLWREFGTLQADGCNYMCRCRGTREPTRYKPMDDAIADDDFSADNDNDNDGDDAMLPM